MFIRKLTRQASRLHSSTFFQQVNAARFFATSNKALQSASKRQIILDTETTGFSPKSGHRIIEVGCVELIDRKLTGSYFHRYINPQRDIDPRAQEAHGITREFLADKPEFAAVADELIRYIDGAELVIHNAPFDVRFLNHEFDLLKLRRCVTDMCSVVDTLAMARELHKGEKNSLDALCERYAIDNSQRAVHGALLDAKLLAQVYLALSGIQLCASVAQPKFTAK